MKEKLTVEWEVELCEASGNAFIHPKSWGAFHRVMHFYLDNEEFKGEFRMELLHHQERGVEDEREKFPLLCLTCEPKTENVTGDN